MIIATYNVWNSEAGMPARTADIINEILKVNADVICLQEVSDDKMHEIFVAECNYNYSCYCVDSELSVLSKFPITQTWVGQYSLTACISVYNMKLSITNLHLLWDNAYIREKTITEIVECSESAPADYLFIMGDFNCSVNSSVHRFLKNEQSLFERSAYYFDLAEAYSEISQTLPGDTLDFRNNPRWNSLNNNNTIELNQRFDRIMLKNSYPNKLPLLVRCSIFGTAIGKETGLCASDHYGVLAELEF